MMPVDADAIFLAKQFLWGSVGSLCGRMAVGSLSLPRWETEGGRRKTEGTTPLPTSDFRPPSACDLGDFGLVTAAGFVGMTWGMLPEHAALYGLLIGLAGRPLLRSVSRPVLRSALEAAARRVVASVEPKGGDP